MVNYIIIIRASVFCLLIEIFKTNTQMGTGVKIELQILNIELLYNLSLKRMKLVKSVAC